MCRDWYFAFDYWNTISLPDVDHVAKVIEIITSSTRNGTAIGSRIKSIDVRMLSSKGTQKAIKLVKLLKLIPQVERIHLEVTRKGLAVNELVSEVVWKALADLKHVKHFAIIWFRIRRQWNQQKIAADRLKV